jgi:hypothetical protein
MGQRVYDRSTKLVLVLVLLILLLMPILRKQGNQIAKLLWLLIEIKLLGRGESKRRLAAGQSLLLGAYPKADGEITSDDSSGHLHL